MFVVTVVCNYKLQLYTFVGASYIRWNKLKLDGEGLTMKKLCPTRWSSRYSSLRAVKNKHGAIIRLLTNIVLLRQEGHDMAAGLLKRVSSFEFTSTLVLWEKILGKVEMVSKMLQSKDLDLTAVTTSLSSLLNHLDRLENNFDSFLVEAVQQAKFAGAGENFVLDMTKNLYRYTGRSRGLGCDELAKEDVFKASVFLPSIRRCKEQARLRFEGHHTVVNSFRCLQPKFILSNNSAVFLGACKNLQQVYCNDLSPQFVDQMISLKDDLESQMILTRGPKGLLELLLESDLQTLYPEVITSIVIFLTIPVTVASAERSFSKLKLIKTYLRSTMSQDRLQHFAILSIEHTEADNLDRSVIVKKFATAKLKRRKRLGFTEN